MSEPFSSHRLARRLDQQRRSNLDRDSPSRADQSSGVGLGEGSGVQHGYGDNLWHRSALHNKIGSHLDSESPDRQPWRDSERVMVPGATVMSKGQGKSSSRWSSFIISTHLRAGTPEGVSEVSPEPSKVMS
jgi:hypothetical protein